MTKEYPSRALAESARARRNHITKLTAMAVAGVIVGLSLYTLTFRSLAPSEVALPITIAAVSGAVLVTLVAISFRHAFKVIWGK